MTGKITINGIEYEPVIFKPKDFKFKPMPEYVLMPLLEQQEKLRANPTMIKMWSERTKCWMCKHRFEKAVIMPVNKPQRGKLQPNHNSEVLFHLQDTHGVPHDAVTKMIFNNIYGIENTMQSVYGETHD